MDDVTISESGGPPQRIAARKCVVAELDRVAAETFLAANHRQGCASAVRSIFLGLIYEGDPVAVAQFGRPRTSKKQREYRWELVRLCFASGVRVMGGGSKLLKHFMRTYEPEDFFTYQDMRGEGGEVYRHAGMRLRQEAKPKTYLVAPGKTVATAQRKEAFSVAEISRRGPDALLGLRLGEVYRTDGRRKTNPELFKEELGWHEEITAGDRVWEWINPDRTYYLYRISATDSPKYYYGVSHIKKANATVEDCKDHDYWGSGGTKFKNWKARHSGTLVKTMIAVYPSRGAALKAESRVVDSNALKDENCLNSTEGGARYLPTRGNSIDGWCEVHGSIVTRFGVCHRCNAAERMELRHCAVHGDVLHWKSSGVCLKCKTSTYFTLQECRQHGKSKYRGGKCLRCQAEKGMLGSCNVHGQVTFRHGVCQSCKNQKTIEEKYCTECKAVTVHQGNSCCSCTSKKRVTLLACPTHGKTKHMDKVCRRCSSEEAMKQNGLCSVHGETKFQHGKCVKCSVKSSITVKDCAKHGSTKHRGDSCYRCRAEKRFSLKLCPKHGEVKHSGDSCIACSNSKGHTKRKELKNK